MRVSFLPRRIDLYILRILPIVAEYIRLKAGIDRPCRVEEHELAGPSFPLPNTRLSKWKAYDGSVKRFRPRKIRQLTSRLKFCPSSLCLPPGLFANPIIFSLLFSPLLAPKSHVLNPASATRGL